MNYALDRFEQEIREAIRATGRVPDDMIDLSPPKANIAADLAFPTFRAAKVAGTPPPQFAQQLADTLQFGPDSLVAKVQATGPFLNFSLDTEQLTGAVLQEIEQRGVRYGSDDLGAGEKVIVEYSSPNIARRMHIGHVRSTIIGQSLNNILSSLGYTTIADNHLGDYGKQFGTLLAAVERFGRPEGEGEAILAQLEEMYARYNRLIGAGDADSEDFNADAANADDAARAWSLKLEQGDPTARELWQWMVDATIRANQGSYKRMRVDFDTQHGAEFLCRYAARCDCQGRGA